MGEREIREKYYFDELAATSPAARTLLHRYSQAFYDKGRPGAGMVQVLGSTDLRGALVLDYGCGEGDFSRILASRGARVFGIDISPKLHWTSACPPRPDWDQRAAFPCFW